MALFLDGYVFFLIFPKDPVFTMWLTENAGTDCLVSFTYMLLQCVRSRNLTQGTHTDSAYFVCHVLLKENLKQFL